MFKHCHVLDVILDVCIGHVALVWYVASAVMFIQLSVRTII